MSVFLTMLFNIHVGVIILCACRFLCSTGCPPWCVPEYSSVIQCARRVVSLNIPPFHRVSLVRTPSSQWRVESVKAEQHRLWIKYNCTRAIATEPITNYYDVRQHLITCLLHILNNNFRLIFSMTYL